MKFIFYLVLFYLLYKLIFEFIIPVSKATNQIKKNMRDINAQQQNYYRQQEQATAPQPEKKAPPSSSDYIDFEEVK